MNSNEWRVSLSACPRNRQQAEGAEAQREMFLCPFEHVIPRRSESLSPGGAKDFFAGIWIPQWKSVRKVKEGETINDMFAFLTTHPNKEVAAIHPKAMPVTLTTPEEIEMWLTAPTADALKLQRPLPDGALKIVARGAKKDGE